MATTDDTRAEEAQAVPTLAEGLNHLSRAISLVKIATRAPISEVDCAQYEDAMDLVIEQLDAAYNAMDLAIVHAKHPAATEEVRQ